MSSVVQCTSALYNRYGEVECSSDVNMIRVGFSCPEIEKINCHIMRRTAANLNPIGQTNHYHYHYQRLPLTDKAFNVPLGKR